MVDVRQSVKIIELKLIVECVQMRKQMLWAVGVACSALWLMFVGDGDERKQWVARMN